MKMNLQPQDHAVRKEAVNPTYSYAVTAPAGSGKTGLLLLRLLNCLSVVERPEYVLAITFTNMAANEIRARVAEALTNAATGIRPAIPHDRAVFDAAQKVLFVSQKLGWNIESNLSALRIMTFDAYCAQLTRYLPVSSGFGGGNVSNDPMAIYRHAIISLFNQINNRECPDELKDALGEVLGFSSNRIESLVPLLSNMLAKRDQWASDLLVMDAHVSERVIQEEVSRIFSGVQSDLDAIGFDRFISLLDEASTESEKLAWVHEAGDANSVGFLRAAVKCLCKADGVVRQKLTAREGFPAKKPVTLEANEWLSGLTADTVSVIEDANQKLALLPDANFTEKTHRLVKSIALVMRYLLAHLGMAFDGRGQVDFTEIAIRACKALAERDAFDEEQKVKHILVDEMQDTSYAQKILLEYLVDDWEPEDGRTLFFCGDIHQSVYRFRGAVVSLYQKIVEDEAFVHLPMKHLSLTTNFRSCVEPVEWVNRYTKAEFGDSVSSAIPFTNNRGSVTVHPFIGMSEVAEAERVVEIIKQSQQDDPQSDLAVLVRSRAHFKYLIPALKREGIPFESQDIDTLEDSPHVMDVLGLIKALWHDGHKGAWTTLLRAPFVGLSWQDCEVMCKGSDFVRMSLSCTERLSRLTADGQSRVARLINALEEVEESAGAVDLISRSKSLWFKLGGAACITESELEDIHSAFDLLSNRCEGGLLVDLEGIERDLGRLYAKSETSNVTLMTIHKSKGLEFDTVVLMGLGKRGRNDDPPLFHTMRLQDGFVIAPSSRLEDSDSSEARLYRYMSKRNSLEQQGELRRLGYVAATRAKNSLHLVAGVRNGMPESGSLLEAFWDQLADDFENAVEVMGTEAEDRHAIPSVAKLPADYVSPEYSDCFVAPVVPVIETEALHRNSDHTDFKCVFERSVGIAYHSIMENMSKSPAMQTSDPDSLIPSIKARLRSNGCPERRVEEGAERVVKLVSKSLSCPHGQWIIADHESASSELEISGLIGGVWKSCVIDRSFACDGYRWIIDYKTAQCPAGISVSDFVKEQKGKYFAKMQEYKEAVTETGEERPIKLALYLPDVNELCVY